MSTIPPTSSLPVPSYPLPAEFPPLKNDLILRAARGEKTERVPIWVHRQAGRYLPEFLEVRKHADFFTMCQTPELATEVTLQPIRRFALDAAIIFSDILVIPQAMGLEVKMEPGKGPVLPSPLHHPDEMKRLTPRNEIDVDKSLGYVFKAITLTRHGLAGRVPLLGFAGAPWTLMAYMVEGGGSKSYDDARAWLYTYPKESHELLSRITDVIIPYLIGQVRAGAQMLEVFDSWAGDLTPALFKEFSLPYLKTIVSRVKSSLQQQSLPSVPITIFAKGAYFAFEELAATEYDVLSIDWQTPIEMIRKIVPNKTIQGNLDVAILHASSSVIEHEVKQMIHSFGTQRYIANLGHGMLPSHKPEALNTFVETTHAVSDAINKK